MVGAVASPSIRATTTEESMSAALRFEGKVVIVTLQTNGIRFEAMKKHARKERSRA